MAFKGHRSISHHDGSTPDAWLTYTCGHCNTQVSGAVVSSYSCLKGEKGGPRKYIKWLLCTNCVEGSVQTSEQLFPGAPFGPLLEGLPNDVQEAYTEAKRCMEVNAFTAAELICRKILMHVAVEKGAKEGGSFAAYLTHLEKSGYVTPPMKGWVDLIRKHGNKATHKLASPSQERSESTVMLTAELLRLIYEMEYMSKKFTPKSSKT